MLSENKLKTKTINTFHDNENLVWRLNTKTKKKINKKTKQKTCCVWNLHEIWLIGNATQEIQHNKGLGEDASHGQISWLARRRHPARRAPRTYPIQHPPAAQPARTAPAPRWMPHRSRAAIHDWASCMAWTWWPHCWHRRRRRLSCSPTRWPSRWACQCGRPLSAN